MKTTAKPLIVPKADSRVLRELRLPRKVEESAVFSEVSKWLKAQPKVLWEKSPYRISEVAWTSHTEAAILAAHQAGKVEIGIEKIARTLDAEKRGLDALNEKQGKEAAQRVSRLLITSQDGTKRLYRACEKLLTLHGDRLLMLRFLVASEQMGQTIFGPERSVKSILITDREHVESVLLSLVVIR